MKRVQFVDFVLNEFEETRIRVKMDGVDLHLHGIKNLVLRTNVQWTIRMQLL